MPELVCVVALKSLLVSGRRDTASAIWKNIYCQVCQLGVPNRAIRCALLPNSAVDVFGRAVVCVLLYLSASVRRTVIQGCTAIV